MVFRKIVVVAFAAALLAGCTSMGGTKETVGTVGGAIAGGVIGSQFGGGTGKLVATGVGTLLGAFIGKEIGASLDRADLAHMGRAQEAAYSAPVGETISWNNPESGRRGTITTTRDGWNTANQYCREFQQTIYVDGRAEQAYGTACKQADGTWKVIG